ncbi:MULTISPECIES: ATP-binding protein [Methanobacterium]|uniref:AAA family ATPase n=1 Tax=Methanobacterium bryantii TaxID=2161 RepID=A0A2A2HA07_METBR|nr:MULTISPECIES: ATP-binding protein [Methanobacterium]OEC87054.1 AAA family ATPase [Methanobacterium sp. A39]PAV06120.1 AAA family ATPase [Methanobacterium bryantii]
MYRLTSKLVIYKNIDKDSILFRLSNICQQFAAGDYEKADLITDIYVEINRMLDISTRYGFDKNLWHNYLAFVLAMTENPFTLVSEKVGASVGTVNKFARSDFCIFKQLFDYDFSEMEKELDIDCFTIITNYEAVVKSEQIFNKGVSEKVQQLSRAIEQAKDETELYQIITDFYKTYGVGKFGLNKAFRISNDDKSGILCPITATSDVILEDLVGYESQKKELVQNTEAFVEGRRANNVLLYGDAGTGKSASIKGILNQYYSHGLRMIEVYKHEFKELPKVIEAIKNRNYRFIIYMDDLSFEEFEIEYKYLKAVMEGGLESKPENVLIYATSNRRHLVRETWSDRSDMSEDELHRSDTMQEKLSLAERFGVTIAYFKPMRKEYFNIVINLARRHPEIKLTDEELRAEASKWEMRHGGMSGRTAQQFIDSLLGSVDLS